MNELLVFICDGAPVRGEIVSIGSAWQAIQERRNDPPAVCNFKKSGYFHS